VIARDRVIEELHVDRDGYAILANILARYEVEHLVNSLKEVGLRQRSRAGIRHLLGFSVVSQIANDPRLLGIAQSVLGEDAFSFRATLFDKSPDVNWLIPWHQDTALPLREKHEISGWGPWSVKEGVTYAHAPASALDRVVALRLHLDDSTAENGPLRVIPGTHRSGVLTDQQVEAAVASIPPATCLVPPGGVIVMRPLIIHASSKSESTTPRRVLHIEYATRVSIPAPLQLAIS